MFFGDLISRSAIFLAAFVAIILVGLASSPSLAADLEGKATIVDGGTIEIGAQRLRLFGIDAPAADEVCTAQGNPWNCGQQATWALAYELAEHWLVCRDTGPGTATCFIGGNRDVGERMVRLGWARAADRAYADAEAQARASRAGLWR